MARVDLGTIKLEYRYAWWLKYYLQALIIFCMTFGVTPDVDKLTRMFLRAARWRIGDSPKWRKIL